MLKFVQIRQHSIYKQVAKWGFRTIYNLLSLLWNRRMDGRVSNSDIFTNQRIYEQTGMPIHSYNKPLLTIYDIFKSALQDPKSKGHFASAGIAPTCKMHMKGTFEARRERAPECSGPLWSTSLYNVWAHHGPPWPTITMHGSATTIWTTMDHPVWTT